MNISRVRVELGLVCLLAGLLAGCGKNNLSPSGDSITGKVDGAAYSYHYWQDGLAVLLWHDLPLGEESCRGAVLNEGLLYRVMCSVSAPNGRHFAWELHTEDGKTADLWIDLVPYDSSKGKMFFIKTGADGFEVTQLEREFSSFTLAPDAAEIEALAADDTAVSEFIENIAAE